MGSRLLGLAAAVVDGLEAILLLILEGISELVTAIFDYFSFHYSDRTKAKDYFHQCYNVIITSSSLLYTLQSVAEGFGITNSLNRFSAPRTIHLTRTFYTRSNSIQMFFCFCGGGGECILVECVLQHSSCHALLH